VFRRDPIGAPRDYVVGVETTCFDAARPQLCLVSEGSAQRAPILVIEDDYAVREALAQVLMDEGYDVDCAEDGAAALERLRTSAKPSCIILDLWMPRLNGFGFREAQLASEETAHIPVVVVTAGGVAPKEMAALGLAYVLHKPVDLDILLRVVRRLSSDAPKPDFHPHVAR
jgi:CheY-like chemotaxis protein